LACDLGDQVEVIIVVKQREPSRLGGSGNKQIWDLPSSLAAGCQKALDLPGTSHVIGGALDEFENRQVSHVLVPFASVAASVADLQVGDASSAQLTRMR
jgi:hypothetical protein